MAKSRIVPPRSFRAANDVQWAAFSAKPPPFIRPPRVKGARAAGLRYEAKAQQHFQALWGEYYVPGPWFRFGDGQGKVRWCQPDGLLFLPYTGKIIIVEMKLQHTSDAWWQTKWLYMPVLYKIFPPRLWDYACCEVVKWYDPATLFPEQVRMLPNPAEARSDQFAVHIWKG